MDEEALETAEESVALLEVEAAEEGGRPVVQHLRAHAPLPLEPTCHRARHAEVAVERAANDALVDTRDAHERVARPKRVLEDGVAEVVPVDDHGAPPQKAQKPRGD